MPTLTVKVHDSAMERLKAEAAIHRVSLSEWVRHKLGIQPNELLKDDSDDRTDDHERRLSRLEEMAGL